MLGTVPKPHCWWAICLLMREIWRVERIGALKVGMGQPMSAEVCDLRSVFTRAFPWRKPCERTASVLVVVVARGRGGARGRGENDFPRFIFANVGRDSNLPETISTCGRSRSPYAALRSVLLLERSRGRVSHRRCTRSNGWNLRCRSRHGWDRTGNPVRRSRKHAGSQDRGCRSRVAKQGSTGRAAERSWGLDHDNEVERVRSEFNPRLPSQRCAHPLIDLRLNEQDRFRDLARP